MRGFSFSPTQDGPSMAHKSHSSINIALRTGMLARSSMSGWQLIPIVSFMVVSRLLFASVARSGGTDIHSFAPLTTKIYPQMGALSLGSQGATLLTKANPRLQQFRRTTSTRIGQASIAQNDQAVAEKLELAQAMITRVKRALRSLREELLDRNMFSGPVERVWVIEIISVFTPKTLAPMRPLLDRALAEILPKLSDVEALTALISSMAVARLPHEPAWRSVGDSCIKLCRDASAAQLTEMAWAFGTAGEMRPELFNALKAAMSKRIADFDDIQKRTCAWACAEVGEHAVELFGEPAVVADQDSSQIVLKALARLGSGGAHDVQALGTKQVPIVLVQDVISQQEGEELIRMADEAGLWASSSRRGARSKEGIDALRTSSSAVLSSPQHREHGVVKKIQKWAADTLAVPVTYVESLQLVRYYQGQQYGAHVDWGRSMDASLWLGGQRTATALIYLNSLPTNCGGETAFDQLNLRVSPTAGSALVWPNVDEFGQPEPLVEHRALPVLCDSVKYAVNVWVRGQALPNYSSR